MKVICNQNCNLTPIRAMKQNWVQPKFSYMKNPRPDYGIMLVLNGRIDFVSRQSDTLCAKAGDIILLPKDSYYDAMFMVELGEIDNYLINFESDNVFTNLTKPELIAENADFSCVKMFERFVEENYNIEEMSFRCKGLFYLLMDSVFENKNRGLNNIVKKAMTLLEENEDISISKIASECHISESGLRKIFKDNMGISPTQYRLNEKLNKAKYLLESTDMSVGEISDKLHFYDAAYFCRMFSKQLGVTPKKYARNKRL